MPRTVIVDHNGGVDVHIAVKSNDYDQVNDYVKIHAGRRIHHPGPCFGMCCESVLHAPDVRRDP